jgi:imidazolonepropionase
VTTEAPSVGSSRTGILRSIGCLATPEAASSEPRVLRRAALVWRDGLVEWVGEEAALPEGLGLAETGYAQHEASGALVVPGLIDCHTHLAFGGWRADEFVERLKGTSYLEIARAGGGIARTVRQTRAASAGELYAKAAADLEAMRALGVTTVECKSGYGLSYEHELELLEVYRALASSQPSRIVPTLLAAHVVPAEHARDRDGYLRMVTERLIPEVARRGLARFCDVFVEDGAFSVEEARAVLRAGLGAGLAPKLHVDQLGGDLEGGGGASLAAEVQAASADHLEHVSERGIADLAEAGVVAVSLPIASAVLAQPMMPARRLLEAGVAVAVATDYNPGTAPSFDLHLAMWLACTVQRLAPAEVLRAVTLDAARALLLHDEIGSLEPGKVADFVLLDAPDLDHWLYHFRQRTVVETFVEGERVGCSAPERSH